MLSATGSLGYNDDNFDLTAGKYYFRWNVDSFDLDALDKLLEYNKEDVVNLKTLKAKLLCPYNLNSNLGEHI